MKSTDQNVPKRNWNVGSNALSIPLGAMLIWWCVLSPQVLIFRRAWRRESNVKRGSTGKVSGVTVLSGWRTALLARCRANLRCCIIYLRARSFVCDSSVAFLPYLKCNPYFGRTPVVISIVHHFTVYPLLCRCERCTVNTAITKESLKALGFFLCVLFPTSHFPFFFHPDWTDSFGNAERPVASAGLVRPEPVAVEGVAQDLSPHKVLGTKNRTRSPLSSYQSRRVGGVLTVWTVGTGLALTLTSCSALWHPLYGVPRAAFFLRCLSFPRLPPRSV